MENHFVIKSKGDIIYDSREEGCYWFVMQTPPRKAVKVKEFLDENSIECIVPMHYQEVVRRGKVHRELVSALDNFIYINSSEEELRKLKKHLPYITYVKSGYPGEKQSKHKIYIDREVVDFYRLLEQNYQDDIIIVSNEDISYDENISVTPKSGIFKDIPLFFESIKGIKNKCATLNLESDIIIAVKSLTPEMFM